MPEDKDSIESLINLESDLKFELEVELLPEFDLLNYTSISLEKDILQASEEDLTLRLNEILSQNKNFITKEAPAQMDDRLTIDFLGSIDGVPFKGGSAEGFVLQLGSAKFIPGFEEALVGCEKNEKKSINLTFPLDYGDKNLAGKEAVFEVSVSLIEEPIESKVDEVLAKKLGFDTCEAFLEAVKKSLQDQYNEISQIKLKKKLLDLLDSEYVFSLPEGLVNKEFDLIWKQVQQEMESTGKTFESEGTTEEKARDEYIKLAQRRVKLGLVISKIGEKEALIITPDELKQGLFDRARQFPGQERQVWEYYTKNPEALSEIRAPLFEQKVVNIILEKAVVAEKEVSREEFLSSDEAQLVLGRFA